jgi:hypothetical protein
MAKYAEYLFWCVDELLMPSELAVTTLQKVQATIPHFIERKTKPVDDATVQLREAKVKGVGEVRTVSDHLSELAIQASPWHFLIAGNVAVDLTLDDNNPILSA